MHRVLYYNDDFNLTNVRSLLSSNITVAGSSRIDQKMAVIATLICLSVIGSLGNGLVIVVYGRMPIKDSSKIFILALACTDMFASVVIMPFTAAYLQLNFKLNHDELCKLYQFLITSDIPLSAFLMVTIAFDRYFSICYPFLKLVTVPRAKKALLVPFITACCLGCISSLSQGVYTYENISRSVNTADLIKSLNVTLTESCSKQQYCDKVTADIDDSLAPPNSCFSLCSNASYVEPFLHNKSLINEDDRVLVYTEGYCLLNSVWYSAEFYWIYQKIYASFFLISLLMVFVLYCKIYLFVAKHRSMQSKVKGCNCIREDFSSVHVIKSLNTSKSRGIKHKNISTIQNALSISLVCHPAIGLWASRQNESPYMPDAKNVYLTVKKYFRKVKSLQDVKFAANVRTAAILAVVAVVFTVCFLPGWLMAVNIIPFQLNVFYMYFFYNVANPFIYAFMNPTFRKEMKLMWSKYIQYK